MNREVSTITFISQPIHWVTAIFIPVIEPKRSRSDKEPFRSLRDFHWPFAIVCLIIAVLIALMAAFTERSAKEAVERVYESQQRQLHDETEELKADLNEMHDKVHRLQDDYTKTRQENEWLKQENQEQNGTIEATRKEVYDLKEKLNEMQNECDLAREKEKKENEECRKMINDQRQTIQELRIKLQATERLSQNGESKLPVSVNLWLMITAICTVILVWCLNRCKTRNKQ